MTFHWKKWKTTKIDWFLTHSSVAKFLLLRMHVACRSDGYSTSYNSSAWAKSIPFKSLNPKGYPPLGRRVNLFSGV